MINIQQKKNRREQTCYSHSYDHKYLQFFNAASNDKTKYRREKIDKNFTNYWTYQNVEAAIKFLWLPILEHWFRNIISELDAFLDWRICYRCAVCYMCSLFFAILFGYSRKKICHVLMVFINIYSCWNDPRKVFEISTRLLSVFTWITHGAATNTTNFPKPFYKQVSNEMETQQKSFLLLKSHIWFSFF